MELVFFGVVVVFSSRVAVTGSRGPGLGLLGCHGWSEEDKACPVLSLIFIKLNFNKVPTRGPASA